MIMPSLQSVPSIRVDLLDGSPRSLSSSSTLNIRDILNQVDPWPNLLAEDFVFDDVDDALGLEDGHLQAVPSFPIGCRPPLFILHAHRTRLPFPIRQEAFEMGDFCIGEDDTRPLLTAPTIPRMKMMIKEQLYVQKWVDNLTLDNPPKHIPWSCEKPATERKWIAEGSIFPSEMVKVSTEQCAASQQPSSATCANRSSALADRMHLSSKSCALSETSSVSVKSAGANSRVPRGESNISRTLQSITKVSQSTSPPTIPPRALLTGIQADAPLAARRGKTLGGLILKGSAIEQLEYPDIPTAFRGSPSVWSPQFEAFPLPSFTDHQSMLLNLRSKGAALESDVSTYILENSRPCSEVTRTALNVDEWVPTRGPVDENPREVTADPSVFLPGDSSTLARGLDSSHLGFVSRPHSTPALQSPVRQSSDPPGTPLPPRPALVNPSTPPHVRGILKKVKSVRFEDVVISESLEASLIVSPLQASLERALPQHSAVSIRRPSTPMPITTKSRGSIKEIPVLGRNVEETKLAPRSRPPPKRTKADRIERPCRIAHVQRNTSSGAVLQAQTKQKGLSITDTDVRRGIEGTTKSRLSTPLRNIFRFK